MLDIKFIRDNPELVKQAIANKNTKVDLDLLMAIDKRRRELIGEKETLQAEQNKKSKGGPKDPVEIEALKSIKDQIRILEGELTEVETIFNTLMYSIPNIPFEDVPVGKGEADNKILREVGKKPEFNFQPKDHLDLGIAMDLIDTERAAKISGSRFAYLKNEAVILQFALVQFALNFLAKKGFQPIIPPVLIRQSITKELGYWQAGGNENYYWVLEDDVPKEEKEKGLYLIGTGEHSIVPMYKDEIIDIDKEPKRFIAYSTCFRREAGTYGKDTRGILRVHQFDKLEMVSFVKEEQDIEEHDYMLSLQEELLQELRIPYRVVKVSTGDMSFPAARQYDLEAWIPSQDQYREVTSTSSTRDFQSRRLNIRYKTDNTPKFAHILNGTAFAIGRTMIAIMENYQTEKGTIMIPKVLRQYMFGLKEISRSSKS